MVSPLGRELTHRGYGREVRRLREERRDTQRARMRYSGTKNFCISLIQGKLFATCEREPDFVYGLSLWTFDTLENLFIKYILAVDTLAQGC